MKYISPISQAGLPQGHYEFQPLVKHFADYVTPILLEDDINAWLQSVVPLPDIRYTVLSMNYQCTQLKNNKLRYSALVHYIEVTKV